MEKISEKIKFEILKAIISERDAFGDPEERTSILDFLGTMFDLKFLPSEDSRYDNAYDDAYQHLVNNDDWDYEYLFTRRFNVVDHEDAFIGFINNIMSPAIRQNEDEIMRFYLLLNPYLEKEKFSLVVVEYDENEFPVYEVKSFEEVSNIPIGLKQNNILFYVDNSPRGRADKRNAHGTPPTFPSFILALNDGWNDYSVVSDYHLFYYPSESGWTYIGNVKIIHKEDIKTSNVIPNTFTILPDDFCSLGQEYSYYEKLKNTFEKDFKSILWALKDAAFFPEIHEEFENNSNFTTSLIRDDEPERLLREAKYRVYDYNLKNLYSFNYTFRPKFAENNVNINFDFESSGLIPNRIFAIIGKNGTGKTQLITTLPIDIYKKKDECFSPKVPLFSKVIAVSYSAFDNFEIPKKTADFNYLYCGLKDSNDEMYSQKALKLRFHNSWKKIRKLKRMNRWRKILLNFLDEELADDFIVINEEGTDFTVSVKGFTRVSKMLSSGQSVILYIVTEIVANVRYDSLIIYDEPETHLHPNAITQLINTIYQLVNEFESYCIMATHSPLIIRELLSKNVFVIEREDNYSTLRKIGIETFGENLTILTDEVFGNKSIPNQFKIILQKMVKDGGSYEQVIIDLESDEIPISLNARIYLKSLFNEKS